MESPTKRWKQTRPNRRHARGRQFHWRRLVVPLALIVLGSAIVLIFLNQGQSKGEKTVSRQLILQEWKKSDWAALRASCDAGLEKHPLDVFYLGMKGIASFYDAMALQGGDNRDALIADAIVSIRKSLAVGGSDFGGIPRAQLEYILAKAYYHAGGSSMDLAATYLLEAEKLGYAAPDLHEYLAMIESSLGNDASALAEFDKAIAIDSSPMLRIAAASVQIRRGNADKAEILLKEAISGTQDIVAVEKARLLLAQVYFSKSRWDDCEAQLTALVAENPESAEAYYQLGLLYQAKGDQIHARAEWRKAVSIDPMHAGARQKLAERS